jgi:predicted component of type VI protein secretion system
MTENCRLVMNQGPQPGQTFTLDQDLLMLGRDQGNHIVISDPQVSRRHARIMRQGDLVVIEDVGSTNGTFVNGMRLTGPHTLVDGDLIGLGDAVTLTYRGTGVATTEPIAGRPAVSPVPPPARAAAPPPAYAAAPESAALPAEETKRKKWLWVGCGCLALLAIAACAAVFVLDSLRLLPDFFYEPLRWLGFI